MCEAVAVCHDAGVYHRDIKPENFIVTDGWFEGRNQSRSGKERRVVVKLTDFGLSTKEVESRDMDCGSAPYMSYGGYPHAKSGALADNLILQSARIIVRRHIRLVPPMSGL